MSMNRARFEIASQEQLQKRLSLGYAVVEQKVLKQGEYEALVFLMEFCVNIEDDLQPYIDRNKNNKAELANIYPLINKAMVDFYESLMSNNPTPCLDIFRFIFMNQFDIVNRYVKMHASCQFDDFPIRISQMISNLFLIAQYADLQKNVENYLTLINMLVNNKEVADTLRPSADLDPILMYLPGMVNDIHKYTNNTNIIEEFKIAKEKFLKIL